MTMVRRKQPAAGQRGRIARQQERRKIGSLADNLVTKRTKERYTLACRLFFLWLRAIDKDLPGTVIEFDLLVKDYLEELWQQGEPRSLAVDLLSGLCLFRPCLRGTLHCGKRWCDAWKLHELPCQAPPLLVLHVLAMAGRALLEWNDISLAVAIMLAFHCFLRTGEILTVKLKDIVLDSNCNEGVVALPLTKSGRRYGHQEAVVVSDWRVARLLGVCKSSGAPGDTLVGRSSAAFRSHFAKLLDSFKLDSSDFKPYSLRRGGATHDFRTHGDLSRTMLRGRWGCQRTARIYINESLAALTELTSSKASDAQLKHWEQALLAFLGSD